jgi:hypothetical protein
MEKVAACFPEAHKKIRLDYEAHLFLFLESGTTFVETRFAPTIFVNVDAIAIDALAL